MGYAFVGLRELIRDFDNLESLTDEIADEMLEAEAEVMVEAEKATATIMLSGPYAHHTNPNKSPQPGIVDSIAKGKNFGTATGRYTDIIFKGSQHGERLAAIAYINEFGKTNQPARPFILTAVAIGAPRAVDKAERVYETYLRKFKL